ncbi:3-keto-5-aminohexanoate cleavage protein [Bradyrhizobium elkanii]
MLDLCEGVARRGGNIAPGIGDYPYIELGRPTNEELVRRTCTIARGCGREIASPDDVREILEIS